MCCNSNGILETPKLLLLRDIVNHTGAKIVLSTNWRYYAELKGKLLSVLDSLGLQCIGDTPHYGQDEDFVRPREILAWLKAWDSAPGRPLVTHFVALDDRDLTKELDGEHLEGAPERPPPI